MIYRRARGQSPVLAAASLKTDPQSPLTPVTNRLGKEDSGACQSLCWCPPRRQAALR